MQGELNIIRADHLTEGNFTQISNNILLNQNGIELSWDASCLLAKCLAYKCGWKINWDLFDKKFGISRHRRRAAMIELKEKGYLLVDTYKSGKYLLHDYYFFEEALTEEQRINFVPARKKILESPDSDFQNNFGKSKFRLPNYERPNLDIQIRSHINNTIVNNNIISNNNTIKNTIKNNNTSGSNSYNPSYPKESNKYIINHDSCDNSCNDSNDLISSSEKIIQKNSNKENFSNVTNLNTSKPFSSIKVKKSTKTIKGTLNDGTFSKNKAQILDEQEKQSVKEILSSEQNAKYMSEQTEDEKKEARIQSEIRQIKEQLHDQKSKQGRKISRLVKKNQVNSLIDKDFTDTEVNSLFKDFVAERTEKGKAVSTAVYKLLKDNLFKLSNGDLRLQKEIIKQSIIKQWIDFYEVKDYKKEEKSINPQKTGFVEDENGKITLI